MPSELDHPAIRTLNRPMEINRRRKGPHVNIIGIAAGYHDSSCCLLRDGTLIAAAQEERFSRVKNDKSFPLRAFRYCLEEAGITIADVDCVAYYEDPVLKLGRQVWMAMAPDLPVARRESILHRLTMEQPQQMIRRLSGFEGPIEIVAHHLSHAASSYYFSGFTEAAILTVDGVGDWPTTAYGRAQGREIELFEHVDFPDSLGFFYSAITSYLGFEVNEGEYKVMGLAPYGSPAYVKELSRLIRTAPGGRYHLEPEYFAFLREDSMYTDKLGLLLGQPPRNPESEITQFHMDVAKSAQTVLEEVLLEKIGYLHSKVPGENLCMAGGVALNVVANRRCVREGPYKRLFVQPAAGDAGGAVGAAAVAYTRLGTREMPAKQLQHVYLGPANSSSHVFQMLKASSAAFQDFRGKEEELIGYTVDRLMEGKVAGWCQGRMEFGPRSLGSRSILADPRRSEMRDRINALVKKREAFRPFAPAVLEQEAHAHFDLDHSSPFMLETCQVNSSLHLPAITHVDGSARVQTVDDKTHPRFAALLKEFHRRTGCPILLNTSFNMRGEPIVCTAIEAILCFVRSQIDLLVVEDFILERPGIPPLWEMQARQTGENRDGGEAISHLVYTLL